MSSESRPCQAPLRYICRVRRLVSPHRCPVMAVPSAAAAVIELGRTVRASLVELMDHSSINAVEDFKPMGLDRDAGALGVHRQRTVEKVGCRERHDHGCDSLTSRLYAP